MAVWVARRVNSMGLTSIYSANILLEFVPLSLNASRLCGVDLNKYSENSQLYQTNYYGLSKYDSTANVGQLAACQWQL